MMNHQINKTISLFQHYGGTTVLKSRMCMPHITPRTFKQFCENEASWLIGFEKWLEKKVGFEVSIFTVIQKEYLKKKILEQSYVLNGELIVGPRTYELMRDQL